LPLVKARNQGVFSGRPLQHSQMFADKSRSLPKRGGSLLANITLGWKGLPGTNSITYLAVCKVRRKQVL